MLRLCSKLTSRAVLKHFVPGAHAAPLSTAAEALVGGDKANLVKEEKALLKKLHEVLRMSDAPKDDLDLVLDTRARIEDFFTLVVSGEFNSGKSTLINAMFGEKHLKDGLLPTTNKIHVIRGSVSVHGDTSASASTSAPASTENFAIDDMEDQHVVLNKRMEWLRDIAIIDTPGTNAITKRHEELTQKIIPRADLILFVTSAERPMSDSESVFLEKIKAWGKNVIMVVNKVDILQDAASKKSVLDYVSQNAAKILEMSSTEPLPVFGVSGRSALDARLFAGPDEELESGGDGGAEAGTVKQRSEAKRMWANSCMQPFETHLHNVLSADALIRRKLETPLYVADRVTSTAIGHLEERLDVLEADLKVLELIDENMLLFREDLERDTTHYRSRIGDIVDRVRVSMDVFLADNISITRPDLLVKVPLSSH